MGCEDHSALTYIPLVMGLMTVNNMIYGNIFEIHRLHIIIKDIKLVKELLLCHYMSLSSIFIMIK